MANAIQRELQQRGYEPSNLIVRNSYALTDKVANALSLSFDLPKTMRMTEFDGTLPNTEMKAHFTCVILIASDSPFLEVRHCQVKEQSEFRDNHLFDIRF